MHLLKRHVLWRAERHDRAEQTKLQIVLLYVNGEEKVGVEVSSEFAQHMIRECLTCSAHATREFFLTGFTTDLREDLRRIAVPTLIVHGDRDVQAPLVICGSRTAALAPHSTFHVYENAAHGLFVTHADRLNEDFWAFMRAASEVAR